MRSVTIFIPIMPRSTNAIYSGMHWAKRKAEADRVHDAVALIAAETSMEAFTQPVSISMTPSLGKGARSRDCSNYGYSLKLIEDGLVGAGVIAGDEADKVRSITINANVVDRSQPSGLWVTVTECKELA